MDIEVQNMDEEISKVSFEVRKTDFLEVFKTKMTFKNILEYSQVVPA